MRTSQEVFGIELPIIQAPMAGVQGSALAIAVSNAGGMGSLPCAMLNLDQMRTELSAMRQKTSKPYNVNFFCHTSPEPQPREGGCLARRTCALLRRILNKADIGFNGIWPRAVHSTSGRSHRRVSSARG
jgi:NAD(P)H-dependent flavin oxidoreductase YrpB (nitropropane dioxygenase family)